MNEDGEPILVPANPDAKLAVEAKMKKTLIVTLANAVSYWNELLAFPTYFPVREDVVGNEGWATDRLRIYAMVHTQFLLGITTASSHLRRMNLILTQIKSRWIQLISISPMIPTIC